MAVDLRLEDEGLVKDCKRTIHKAFSRRRMREKRNRMNMNDFCQNILMITLPRLQYELNSNLSPPHLLAE